MDMAPVGYANLQSVAFDFALLGEHGFFQSRREGCTASAAPFPPRRLDVP